MSRQRIHPDRLQADLPPEERGYVSLRLRADVVARIDEYRAAHEIRGRSAAIGRLLDIAARARPTDNALARIRDSLIEELGYAARDRIDAAIARAAGKPRE